MYYKGNIIKVKELYLNPQIKKYKLDTTYLFEDDNDKIKKMIQNVNKNELVKDDLLTDYFNKISIKNNILLFNDLNNLDGIGIIYTLERDIYDNLYAKEILTNKLFPLFTPAHFNIEYKLASINNNNIELITNPKLSSYALYNPEYIVNNFDVASDKDIKKYKNKDKKHIEKIINLYNQNMPQINYQNEQGNNLRYIEMKHVEVLITYLMDKDKNIGSKLKIMYDNLLKSEFTILDLINLEIDINNYLLLYNTNEMTLLSYLNSLKRKKKIEFFMDINKKNMLGLKQLDKLAELFLEERYNYPTYYQLSIMETISYLYFFEVYNNQDDLDTNILNKSLFSRFIYIILICIKKLKNEGFIYIEDNLDIKDVNVEQIFNIIKKVKRHDLDKEKVKKLSLY